MLQQLMTQAAPEPRDVYWYNLSLHHAERSLRTLVGEVAAMALVFFYTIPVAFVQSFSNLETLSTVIPGLDTVLSWSPSAKAFVQGFLPTLALTLFFEFLPLILMSESWRCRA